MDASTVRLFLGLWPGEPVRERLRARRDAWTWPRGATPVATDKLHMTLHFLGDQPSSLLPALLDGVAVPFAPFALSVSRASVWPGGIAVLEPAVVPPELLALHGRLAEALVGLGLQPEARAYRPHVTMARRAGRAGVPLLDEPIAWDVDGYALVQSQGGRYGVLRRYR